MKIIRTLVLIASAAFVLLCSPAHGGEPYVISSSPDISRSSAEKAFAPLAASLSSATGSEFIYRHPGNWSSYTQAIRRSAYDLVFDEAHMVSWLVENLQHTPILKLSGSLSYVIVSRDQDDAIVQLRDLAGYPVCTRPPPMLGGLLLFTQFDDPNRQPLPYQVESASQGFEKLLNGDCRGAILPAGSYEKLAGGGDETRILYLSEFFPNRAFSIGPAIPKDLREKIIRRLLTAGGVGAVENLIGETGTGLLPTSRSDYVGYDYLLDDFWAFR